MPIRFRVIQSGDTVETYYYKTGIPDKNGKDPVGRAISDPTPAEKIEHDSYNRSRNNLRRLVDSNFKRNHTFLTLTFDQRRGATKKQLESLKYCNARLKAFIRAVRRSKTIFSSVSPKDIKYISVPEIQPKSGNWHFHTIWSTHFNRKHLEKLRIIARKHGFGNIDIQRIKHVKALGAYISKYLTKGSYKDVPQGMRHYNTSSNISRPVVHRFQTWEAYIAASPKKYKNFFQKEFDSVIGTVVYRLYNI
jgi:hypothetical protein